jgi:hypothetical protein
MVSVLKTTPKYQAYKYIGPTDFYVLGPSARTGVCAVGRVVIG